MVSCHIYTLLLQSRTKQHVDSFKTVTTKSPEMASFCKQRIEMREEG